MLCLFLLEIKGLKYKVGNILCIILYYIILYYIICYDYYFIILL